MEVHSIQVLMMSAVCFYVSSYYFIMYLLRRHERGYLTFSMTCLSVFLYDITCAGLYNADNLTQGVFWQRGNFICTSLIAISMIWFISDYTNTRIGKRAMAQTIFYVVMIPVFAFTDSTLVLTTANPSIKYIKAGSFLDVVYYESATGILCSIYLVFTLISFMYLIHILIRYSRLNSSRNRIKIIVSFCIFFTGSLNDMLVSSGVYSFIYVTEYAFMYIIVVMGYGLQKKFVNLQEEVESLNADLEKKIAERTIELIEKQKKIENEKNIMADWRARMEAELEMARNIQQQIIPGSSPADFIYALFKPMAPVGGDFYDFIKFRETSRIGIFISDVSGHGIPAALITTMLKSLLAGAGDSKLIPSKLLTDLNEILVKQAHNNFVTAFYGIYDRTERTLTYSNAGHNSPFIISNNDIIELDKARTLPLGIYSNNVLAGMNKSYTDFTERFQAGSRLLLYTDGLTETRKGDDELIFFEAAMRKILPGLSGHVPEDFVETLYGELVKFNGSEAFEDDVCIICLAI